VSDVSCINDWHRKQLKHACYMAADQYCGALYPSLGPTLVGTYVAPRWGLKENGRIHVGGRARKAARSALATRMAFVPRRWTRRLPAAIHRRTVLMLTAHALK
jgi:hypothetical protein